MKIRLINWKKVNYTVKAFDMEYMIDHPDLYEYKDWKKYPVVDYGKQPKAWELFFTLIFMLIIYTTFAISLEYFLLAPDYLFPIPLIAMIMTVFMFGNDFMDYFVWWIRLAVILYLVLLFIFILFTFGVKG